MLEKVAGHADELGVRSDLSRQASRKLPDQVRERFDAVFSMGNTLAHLPSRGQLQDSLQASAACCGPAAFSSYSFVNFERVLATRERIQNVKESNGVTFVACV